MNKERTFEPRPILTGSCKLLCRLLWLKLKAVIIYIDRQI